MDDLLARELLGNPVSRWAIALGTCAAVVLVLWVIKRVAAKRVELLAQRTRTPYDDVVVRVIEETKTLSMIAAGVAIGIRTLELPEDAGLWIGRALFAVLVIQLGLWVSNFVRLSLEKRRQEKGEAPGHRTLAAAVGFVVRLVVWSIVLLSILSNVGVEVSTLIAGLGIGGLAAALAVQNVLGELVAAFSIYSDRPFDLGDTIEVAEMSGVVEKIGWRTTHLRSIGGEQIIFANSDLAKARIRNYQRMRERRVVLTLKIEHGTSSEQLAAIPAIVREELSKIDQTRYERAHLVGLGDSSLDFEIVYWILDPDYAAFRDRHHLFLLALTQRFEQAKVGFAFPTRRIHVHRHDPDASGDAAEGDAISAAS